jgi:hypothetical protein
MFLDYFYSLPDLPRGPERNEQPLIFSSKLSIRDLLTRIPVQSWLLPRKRHCVVPFCNAEVKEPMEQHLAMAHPAFRESYSVFSEVQSHIAGLIGLHYDVRATHGWGCPGPRCNFQTNDFEEISEHISMAHPPIFITLYQNLGSFWTAILAKAANSAKWPTMEDIFPITNYRLKPLTIEEARFLWCEGCETRLQGQVPGRRLIHNSPLQAVIDGFERIGRGEVEEEREGEAGTGTGTGGGICRLASEYTESSDEEVEGEGEVVQLPRRVEVPRREPPPFPRFRPRPPNRDTRAAQIAKEIERARRALAEEVDTEHEELPAEPGGEARILLEEGVRALVHIMKKDDVHEVAEGLEEFLRIQEEAEGGMPRREDSLEEPIVELLVRNKSWRICRGETFCPSIGCDTRVHRKERLATHLIHEHGVTKERTQDMMRFYIDTMMTGITEVCLSKPDGTEVRRKWKSERCHYPGCKYLHSEHRSMDNHVRKQHPRMHEDMRVLGEFWGIMRTIIRHNEKTTIAEALGSGEVFQCAVEGCERIFMSERSISQHFGKFHSERLQQNWIAPRCELHQKYEIRAREDEGEGEGEGEGEVEEDEARAEPRGMVIEAAEAAEARIEEDGERVEARARARTRARTRTGTRTRAARGDIDERVRGGFLRGGAEENEEREDEMRGVEGAEEIEEREEQVARFRRRREELLECVEQGVNIPQLNADQMRKVKGGLVELFNEEINPMMAKMQPRGFDEDEWEGFEGAYEEAMHQIRLHIMEAIHRNPRGLYGRRRMNVKLQEAREQKGETARNHQSIRHIMGKLKNTLVELGEGREARDGDGEGEGERGEGEAQDRRREAKLTKRVGVVLRLLDEETKKRIFGSADHAAIWQELNTAPDHRRRVIEWLDSMITTHVTEELGIMNESFEARKVQEAYRTTKGIAMKRYVDKVQSPQCPIDPDAVAAHFGETWAPPGRDFEAATEGSEFYLDRRIPGEGEGAGAGEGEGEGEGTGAEEMEEFMMNEDRIKEVIKSRADLSACGVDGVSYRIFKAAGQGGIEFMKHIIRGVIKSGRVMESWKQARTILLYKKGDQKEIGNWRPISITNWVYRIFTCLMARSFQKINMRYKVFTDNQKGFIQKTNGCSEHAIILNELLHDANRFQKNLVVTAIDFTNAFGSVPHDMIMSAMEQRGFPEWTRRVVEDMYTGASSVIELKGRRSRPVRWRRGVKQGCPLSPLLFNLCVEPLIQAIRRSQAGRGAFVDVGDERVEFSVQAYADDVVFISQEPEGIQEMLETLGRFVEWSQMEVNAKKCATASYMIDEQRHRSTLTANLQFKGNAIPNLTMKESLKYLGTAVAARRTVKLEAIEAKLEEMKIKLQKIEGSKLLAVQKIDAIKTFVLPSIDFILLNGDARRKDLKNMDMKIRGTVDRILKIRGLPIECHHASWRDGGLSYPSLLDRQDVLMIRSFTQMMLSRDEQIRNTMRQMTENERLQRGIHEDAEGRFMNWGDEPGRRGTASISGRTRRSCQRLGVKLKLEREMMRIGTEVLEFKTKTAVGIGRFLTQKIVRPQKIEKLMQHNVHGASFNTLRSNEVSTCMLTNISTKKSDAFFRYVVAARADCLPTPANIGRWYPGRQEGNCRRCGAEGAPTQAHILNACTSNYGQMTKRHNRVVGVVRKAIEEMISGRLRSEIKENTVIEDEGLTEQTRTLRPDLSFEIEGEGGGQEYEIIEFSCPYGYRSRNGDTLMFTHTQKHVKYMQLAEELRRSRNMAVRVTVVIVSSLGAVYAESLKELHKMLKCDNRKLRKLGQRMSEAAIEGSREIWRDYAKTMNHERGEEADAVIAREIEVIEEQEAEREEEERMRDIESEEDDMENEERPEVGERERRVFEGDMVEDIAAISELEDQVVPEDEGQ